MELSNFFYTLQSLPIPQLALMLVNSLGAITFFNAAAEELLEIVHEQAIGLSLESFAQRYHISADAWLELLQTCLENPIIVQVTQTERLFLAEKIIDMQASPIYSADSFLGILFVFQDISKVVTSKERINFIENIPHEFRTPLVGLNGYSDMLMMTAVDKLDPMELDFLQRIKSNAQRLAQLVDYLYTVAMLENRLWALHFDQVDFAKELQHVLDEQLQNPKNAKKALQVELSIEDNLPLIHADAYKIRVMLEHIIKNAFDFSYPQGQVTIKAYAISSETPTIQIEVIDEGVGIADEFRKYIGKRFYRYDQHVVEMNNEGTGLGLWIANEIVKLHHGKIWFESTLGQGTTFYICLPQA